MTEICALESAHRPAMPEVYNHDNLGDRAEYNKVRW